MKRCLCCKDSFDINEEQDCCPPCTRYHELVGMKA